MRLSPLQVADPRGAGIVSGLLRDSAHLRQARSRRLACYPGVAVITLDRPPNRARSRLRRPPLRSRELHDLPARARSFIHSDTGFIPRISGSWPRDCPQLAGMVRVRSGQAPAWPLVPAGVSAVVSRVKRDLGCTFARHVPPVLVVQRSRSRSGWRGGYVHSVGHPRTLARQCRARRAPPGRRPDGHRRTVARGFPAEGSS